MATVEVTLSGPLLDGRAGPILAAMGHAMQVDIAQQGYADVMGNLNASIRNPTPYYETQITVQDRANDLVVHDRGVVYGPWLEGVGSRNSTTRFKGYASFRRAFQTLEKRAPQLAERTLGRYLARLS
jgi:hypothetical protein